MLLKKKKFSTLPCNHILCRKCKYIWLRTNPLCPYCRSYVPKKYNSEYFDMYVKDKLISIGQLKKKNYEQMIEMFKIENIIKDILDEHDIDDIQSVLKSWNVDSIDILNLISYPSSMRNHMSNHMIDPIKIKYISMYNDLSAQVSDSDDRIFYMDEMISNTKYILLESFSDKKDESSKSITKYLNYTKNATINPL